MSHRLPNRNPNPAEKSSAKLGIVPNIGPDFWAVKPDSIFLCNDSSRLFFNRTGNAFANGNVTTQVERVQDLDFLNPELPNPVA
jgi:hypothetical protein